MIKDDEYVDWLIDLRQHEKVQDYLESRCIEWLVDRGQLTGYTEIEFVYLPDAIVAEFVHDGKKFRIPVKELLR